MCAHRMRVYACKMNVSERVSERLCKIPLYNLDSQSNLSTRSILSPINHTQHTLYATRQLSSLARASLEP